MVLVQLQCNVGVLTVQLWCGLGASSVQLQCTYSAVVMHFVVVALMLQYELCCSFNVVKVNFLCTFMFWCHFGAALVQLQCEFGAFECSICAVNILIMNVGQIIYNK